jgi:hypothetical protein
MARVSLQLMHYEYLPADSGMDVDNLASQTLARVLAQLPQLVKGENFFE